jgi:single-stranded-DNA-specific exonuclease
LSPGLSKIEDPMLLIDMDIAVDLILNAIENNENIVIYGDFDADGITATALLLNFFSHLDVPVSFYIPNRFKEGYGLNPSAVEALAKKKTGLMITVDCGISDLEEIALARRLGMKVIVTDHHQVPADFSPICPVVNPHRPESLFPFKYLSGVGLAFFLAIAIRAALRDRGRFKDRPEPDLRHYLDLVALGTVADMVPLQGQNRVLVRAGLERMKAPRWPGLRAIQEIADIRHTGPLSAEDLAFKLAPRLNATGRMGDAATGIRLLVAEDLSLARDLAKELNVLNGKRRRVEQEILDQIEDTLVSGENLEHRKTLVLSGEGWHRGVLGIVASRLVNRYHRPVVVLDIQGGLARGSGRSIPGFHLFHALAKLAPILEKFGGHDQAAGLTLRASNIAALAGELENLARDELIGEALIPAIDIDAEMTLADMSMNTLSHINTLSPFGFGNPEPVFYAHAVEVMKSRVVGESHLSLKVRQGESVLDAIGFGLSDYHLPGEKFVNMVFTPEIDRWHGHERIKLKVIDLEVTGSMSKLRRLGTKS